MKKTNSGGLALLLLARAMTSFAAGPDNETVVHDTLALSAARWRDPLLTIYAARNFEPLWLTGRQLSRTGQALIAELRDAGSRGLRAADYGAQTLAYRAVALAADSRATDRDATAFDVQLSLAAARFVAELHAGRVAPRELGYDLDVPHAKLDLSAALLALATATDTHTVLDGFEPQFHHYRLLKNVLARYRLLSADPQLTQLPELERPRIKPGEYYAGAPALRRLLRALGDLPGQDEPAGPLQYLLAPDLVAALETYQARHGLARDGVLGRESFRELTTPFSERVRRIELSLERWRWLPPKLESAPIIVNIPQFRLFAFATTEDIEQQMLRMNVIVGKAARLHQTPVFAADLRYIVLNPYWDVPRGILVRELLPDILANPSWVRRNGYEIVLGESDNAIVQPATRASVAALAAGRMRLRQKPGPQNALGFVKFMLPNRHNVYLHATPAQALFGQSRRDFSHGCIRVAEPMALLQFLLRGEPDWTPERLSEALQQPGPFRIPLLRPVRVFIVYETALAAEDGRALFFNDIYGQDARLQQRLDARPPGP